jgi:dihydropteroate synthase
MTQQIPLIMGVINVTPDSFSDGGELPTPEAAADKAARLIEEGADLIDLGAESTRPNATPVSSAEEWQRLEPVLKLLQKNHPSIPVSLDTRKPELMLRAADLGVVYVNDVEGGLQVPSETLARLAKYPKMQYIAMHMQGNPQTMQQNPLNADDAIKAVDAFFAERHAALLSAGFSKERIYLDPGIGFGKTDEANFRLMRDVRLWTPNYRVAIGISRKGFIRRAFKIDDPKKTDPATKKLELGLALLGVRMIRTHDVKGLRAQLAPLEAAEVIH